MPAITAVAKTKTSTGMSSPTVSTRGMSDGPNATSARTPQAANARPAPAPSSASSRLSVRNCRMMRARVAPSAARTAISR